MTAAAPPVTPATLNEAMAAWMEAHVGTTETGHNSGPGIDDWLRLVGLEAGNEWCAATVFAAGHYSAQELGLVNPVPRTAGALKLWTLSEPLTHVGAPARGRVFVVDHGGGKGHAGVCLSVSPDGVPTSASGNTNAAGSRLGNTLAVHVGDPTVVHHGVGPTRWIDFGLAVQPPIAVA